MRLPRFRLRTLLIAVALAALICGGLALRRRRANFLDRAQDQAVELRRWTLFAKTGVSILQTSRDLADPNRGSPNTNPVLRAEILQGLRDAEADDDEARRRVAYHAALKAKY